MKPEHIRALRDEKPTPDGSNMRLKALRALFKWAVEANEAPHNPAKEVAMAPMNSDGYHTWTEDEILQFEQRHPIGTKARLAMALMLYTTGRREDATRFGPQHVRMATVRIDAKEVAAKRIVYTQAKNEHRNPVHLDIPLHPELERIINSAPPGHLTFLTTSQGSRSLRRASATGFAIVATRPACIIVRRMDFGKRLQQYSPSAARLLI
jgi:integrase/recombinase XerD